MRILKRATTICIMNLLDKKTFPLGSGLALLLIPFFFACEDPNELGVQVDSNNQDIAVRDTTISIPLSTILIDSLRTNQFTSMLVGNLEDSVTGSVHCTAYTQYSPNSGPFPEDTLNFVSAFISLKINEVRTADNILSGHIDVHESNDTLYNQVIYLAKRKLDYNPTPIAQVDYNINIDQDSVLNIPMNDLGQELFDKLLRADQDSAYRDSLVQNQLYYQPLVFNTTSTNSGLMSLSLSNDTSSFYIEMKSPTSDSTYYYKFNFNGRGHFTNIERDRTGSKLASLEEEYNDEFSGSYAYGSMVDGTFAKLDLAPVKAFIAANTGLIVNNASLQINNTDYGSEFVVPFSSVRFYFIRNGRINGPIGSNRLAAFSSTILADASYSSSNVDYFNAIHNDDPPNYSGEITQFTQIFADDALGIDLNEIVILNPTTTSLQKTIFTEAGMTIYYTVIK